MWNWQPTLRIITFESFGFTFENFGSGVKVGSGLYKKDLILLYLKK